jgi:hypothetical protein
VVAEEGKRRSRAPVRCRRQTVSDSRRFRRLQTVLRDADAHLLATMSVLAVLPWPPS